MPEYAVFEKALTLIKGALPRMAAKAVLNDIYDSMFGICQHSEVALGDPLSSIGYHPAEDVQKDSMEKQYLTRFRKLKVYDKFGIGIHEFFKLSRDTAEDILKQCEQEISATSTNPVMAELEKQMRQS